MLCILGVVLATTFVIAVGATSRRYTTVIKEMNVLFNGQVMVTDNQTIIVQAIPITMGSLPESMARQIVNSVKSASEAVPILFITTVTLEGMIQPVPPNFTIGVPVEDWQSALGPITLKNGQGHIPNNESSSEIIVGSSLADQYNLTIGTEVIIKGHALIVAGISDAKMALLARSVIMPLKTAQKVYNYPDSVNIITVKPAEGYSQTDLAQALTNQLPGISALTEDKRNDIVQPILAEIETWSFGIQTIVFTMSLLLVMTVMLMSVSERRRDFATLDAIGTPLAYIFRLVILEASLIGVIGGIVGISLGSLASIALASLYTNIPLVQFFPSIFEFVSPIYLLETFASIVIVCCIGAILPAINAARMHIADMLRAEY